MATEAQIIRNRQNAKHSTGPRTAAGKNIARMNAIKHGLTAEVVLLPNERPHEFNKRVKGFFHRYLPQDPDEVFLTQDVVYSSWQLERCRRARSARMYEQAITGDIDEERRQEQTVIELAQILLKAPFGRPAACPRGALPDGDAVKAWTGSFELDEHPARVVLRLEASQFGVRLLMEQWDTLELPLQRGQGWGASERFRALRLLRIHGTDAYVDTKLTSLLHACETLDPGAGSLVAEVWGEMVSAHELPLIENDYRRSLQFLPVMDEDAARSALDRRCSTRDHATRRTGARTPGTGRAEGRTGAELRGVRFQPRGTAPVAIRVCVAQIDGAEEERTARANR